MNTRVRPTVAAVLAALAVVGCRTIPLQENVFGAEAKHASAELYSIDWWVPLVSPPPFEYEPREFAAPSVEVRNNEPIRVIVLTRDGMVRSLNMLGKPQWTFHTGAKFSTAATIFEGVVYVPGGDGFLYALDSSTGRLIWKYDAKEELTTSPVVVDGKVLVASDSDSLFVVNQKTGVWLWQYKRDTPSGFTIRGTSRPTVSQGVVFVGFSDGHLAALKLEDGGVKWERSLSSTGQFLDIDTAPVIGEDKTVYVASYKDGLFALDGETGDVRWKTAVTGLTTLTGVGHVLFAAGDARIAAYSEDNGRAIWSDDVKGHEAHLPVLARGLLLVSMNESLTFLEPTTGHTSALWNPGYGISAPPFAFGSHVYVLSNNGYLYALKLRGKAG